MKHQSVTSCLVPLPFIHQKQVTTIEGLAHLSNEGMHPVAEAFYKLGASQCGFCTPGAILSFVGHIEQNKKVNKDELEKIFDGTLCRCTGYRPILDAAAVFCQDPLESEEYKEDIQLWREKYKKSKRLTDIFPEEFREPSKGLCLQGEESSWHIPADTQEILNLSQSLEERKARFIAGNTDLGVRDPFLKNKKISQIKISSLPDLTKIEQLGGGLKIGAAVTIAQLFEYLQNLSSRDVRLQSLMDQCRYFANHQVRNLATVGGGILNFSTYSDLIPVWMAVRAELTFHNNKGQEKVRLIDFTSKSGHLDFKPSDHGLLTSIFVPKALENEITASYKYARRRMDSITFMSAGVSAQFYSQGQTIEDIVVSFDGLGPAGYRAKQTEDLIRGKVFDRQLLQLALKNLNEELIKVFSNPLPQHLRDYQLRLAKGILLRFYAKFREKFYNEVNVKEKRLVSQYPQISHRSEIIYAKSEDSILGKAMPHVNARQQTTGKAKYTADNMVPNCLFAALVKSPAAFGVIESIDASEALKSPDVVAFYSAKDIPGKNLFGFRVEDEEVLASERVQFVGQAVGVLVAKTEEAARANAQKVFLKIREEKALLTIEDALAAKSFHGKKEGYFLKQGDIQLGFKSSKEIVEGEVRLPGQYHFYLEPQTALVVPKDESLQVFSSTQSPSNVVDHVALLLNMDKNHVDVQVGRLGGGFGGKQLRAGPIAAICALAAFKLDQPVKLTLSRSEDMAFCPGRSPVLAKYKAGFKGDGTLEALDIQFYLNGGFSNDYSADITETATLLMDSCYKIRNVQVHAFCLKTNYGSNTSTRGFGKPQASAVIESVLEHGASRLNKDANELRELNLYREGDLTITKSKIKDDIMHSCWSRLKEKSDYGNLQAQISEFNAKNKWLKRGLAMVGSKGNMGFIQSDDINRGLAFVQVMRDGTVSLNHSGVEMGQGINTRMSQVVAYAFGIPVEDVVVTDTQSSIIPNTPPTTMVATDLIGEAIIKACNEIKESLNKFEGNFLQKVEKAYDAGLALSAMGSHTTPRLVYDYEKQQGDISFFFVWGAALSVVEIDVISGSFRVVKSNIVQDCGKSLNPHLDIGQAEGGFLFGLGYYMMEEMIYSEKGQLISDNVSGYKLPSCGDVPLDWDIELLNHNPEHSGLHSSKGIGESNTQLGLSVYFAAKEAVRAARLDAGLSPDFNMGFPASVDRVSKSLPTLESFL